MQQRKLIVLTPVKNEAWILPTFLRATSLWADCIIVSDQGSTDRSREIAESFEKVRVIDNSVLKDFNEFEMRNPLLQEARKIDGEKILFWLDADEFLTPDFESEEWKKMLDLPLGSHFDLFLGNILPKFRKYGVVDYPTPVGFVDDGREPCKTTIVHGSRTCVEKRNTDVYYVAQQMRLMHLQFVDWERMESKHRWYQCFERINYPDKSVIDIYRRYHWMYDDALFSQDVNPHWLEGYKQHGVDITDVAYEHDYWWDDKVRKYVEQFGAEYFKRIDTNHPRKMIEMGTKSWLIVYLNVTKRIYNRKNGLLFVLVRKMDTFLKTRFKI